MAGQPSPVTPRVVRWAVDEDGRTIAELADALKVDPEALESWASGDASPSRGQVSDLAMVLKRPRALFFLPRPPASATLPASFRHPPGDDRSVSARARRRVREARRVQHAVSWTLQDSESVNVPTARIADPPEQAAAQVRTWVGVTDDDQDSWSTDRDALTAWREALDARGVLVFVLEVGRDDVRGFSAWDDRAPLIVANLSGVSPSARIFTIAHELGHLVTRLDSACVEPGDSETFSTDVERWCERFGAAFLMPSGRVQELAARRGIRDGHVSLDDVRAVMHQFRVSGRAAALRLIDIGVATPALYGQVARAFVPVSPSELAGTFRRPPRATSRLREFGSRAISTVLNDLPPRDALSILRIDVEDVRRISAEVEDVPTL